MRLKQRWATLPAAACAAELRSREPPANDRRGSFTLKFQGVGQFSRSDGPSSETGGSRNAGSTACCDVWDPLRTPKQLAIFCCTQRSRYSFQRCSGITEVRAGASSSSLNKPDNNTSLYQRTTQMKCAMAFVGPQHFHACSSGERGEI
jgi:hypothetical protein